MTTICSTVVLFSAMVASSLGQANQAIDIFGPDNAGTEFIIGYMENDINVVFPATSPVELIVTTMRNSVVNVNVTAPMYLSEGIDESFNVTSGVLKRLTFSSSIRMAGTSKESKGVLVTSDDEIVIYGASKEHYSTGAFVGLPVDVLGMVYYATTFNATKASQILVTGIYDSTTVTVQLGSYLGSDYVFNDPAYYYGGDTFSLSMNRYDTFQFQSSGDLSGTKVSADKNIAVFSGNKEAEVGLTATSGDTLVEQLTPVDTWGKTFITVPIPGRVVGAYFRFIASESNTDVTISGGYSETFNLAIAGDMASKIFPFDAYCQVLSNKPILVVQISQSYTGSPDQQVDPVMMIVPPVEHYAASYTFAAPASNSIGRTFNNILMIVVKDAERTGLRLDGSALSTTFDPVPGTDYVGTFLDISSAPHTIRHISPIATFCAYVYGTNSSNTYGYPAGMRMTPINTPCVPSVSVAGDILDNDCDGRIDEELCHSPNNGTDDDGDGDIDEDCAAPWPVHGNWSDWSDFDNCSLPCKDYGSSQTGNYTRNRTCTNPAPDYGGDDCVGSDTETQSCIPDTFCPIHGNWSDWSDFGDCSLPCKDYGTSQTGNHTRNRTCTDPAPEYGGDDCVGSDSDTASCIPDTYCIRRACYYTTWSNDRPGAGAFTPSDVDPYLCTVIIVAFAKVNDDNELDVVSENHTAIYEGITNITLDNPDLKVLLSVGGWTQGSTAFSWMAAKPKRRRWFVSSAISFLRQHNFDGLDLHWLYPAQRGGSNPDTDKANYAILVKLLREEFEAEVRFPGVPRLWLTTAVAAEQEHIDYSYDVPKIAPYVDFITILTLDMHGDWDDVTGHHSALKSFPGETGPVANRNIDWSSRYWEMLGVSRDKINIALTTYGRGFTLSNPADDGIGDWVDGPSDPGPYTGEEGILAYYEICDLISNGGEVTRVSGVPYYVNGSLWIGYDDEQSIQNKVQWLVDEELGGVTVWALGVDDFSQSCASSSSSSPLINTIKDVLTDSSYEEVVTTYTTPSSTTMSSTTTGAPFIDCTGVHYHGGPFPNVNDCHTYYSCVHGVAHLHQCPADLRYDHSIQVCDHAYNVRCISTSTTTGPP